MSLKESIVIVTGAARGLGRATAKEYAKRGARVVLADIRQEQVEKVSSEIKGNGQEAWAYPVDVSSDSDIKAFATSVLKEVGAPDIIYNNAAMIISGGILDIPFEDVHKQVDVNVYGYLRVARAFLPPMIERGSGQIVITSSPNGQTPPPIVAGNLAAYCMCKAADISMAQCLAVSLKDKGISVSVLFPSLTNTEGGHEIGGCAPEEFHQGLAHMMDTVGVSPESVAEKLVQGVEDGKYFVSAQPGYENALRGWLQDGQNPHRDWLAENKPLAAAPQ